MALMYPTSSVSAPVSSSLPNNSVTTPPKVVITPKPVPGTPVQPLAELPTYQPPKNNGFQYTSYTPGEFTPVSDQYSQDAQAKQGLLSSYLDLEAVTNEIDDNQTVAGQLKGLLESDSPYLQAAKSQARQIANERGMMNSSMAAGAGTLTAIQSAMPIAQQDASTYFANAQQNQNSQNQFLQNKSNAGLNDLASQQDYLRSIGLLNAESEANLNLQQEQNKFAAGQDDIDREIADRRFYDELAFNKFREEFNYARDLNLQNDAQNFSSDMAGLEFQLAKDTASYNLANSKDLASFQEGLNKNIAILENQLNKDREANAGRISFENQLLLANQKMTQSYIDQIAQVMTVDNEFLEAADRQKIITQLQNQIQFSLDYANQLREIDLNY